MRLPTLLAIPATALFGAVASAQVPQGHVVETHAGCPSCPGGVGGLWVTHPRLGTTVRITNLPPALTGQNSQPPGIGSAGVRYWAEQDALLVGSAGLAGGPVELWVVHLNGLAFDAARSYAIPLGTLCTGGAGVAGVWIIGRLSPKRVVVSVGPAGVCPGDDQLFVVDLAGRTVVSSLAVTPRPSGQLVSGAHDGAGTVFLAYNDRANLRTTLVAVTLGTGVVSTSRVFQTGGPFGGITGLMWDPRQNRAVVAVGVQNGARLDSTLQWIHPHTLATTRTLAVPNGTGRAIAAEPASDGWIAFVEQPGPKPLIYVDPTGGLRFLRTPSGPGGLGLAVVPDPETYGAPSPASSTLRFEVWPNPGGLPRIGNAGFGLQLRGGGGFWLCSLTRGNTPIAGIDLLLGLPLLATGAVPSSGTIPIPVPNNPALVGAPLRFQGVGIANGQAVASEGLELTVMR